MLWSPLAESRVEPQLKSNLMHSKSHKKPLMGGYPRISFFRTFPVQENQGKNSKTLQEVWKPWANKLKTTDCYLLSFSKQESQTRTSFSMPNLGTIDVFDEHLLQKIWPQARQWCYHTRRWTGTSVTSTDSRLVWKITKHNNKKDHQALLKTKYCITFTSTKEAVSYTHLTLPTNREV